MNRPLCGLYPKTALALGALLALVFLQPATAATSAPGPLVSAEWLRGQLGNSDIVILDMRDTAAFDAGHVPGSLHSEYPGQWRTERNDVPWVLPAVPDLEAYLSGLGVGDDTTVVLVPAGKDGTEFGVVSWPYWVLKYLGHDKVAILDGGWNAWQADAANPVTSERAEPRAATFVAEPRPEILASTAQVAEKLGTSAAIVDARPANQYSGESQSGLVVRAGHIPGAVNISFESLFDSEAGRLKPKAELEAIVSPVLPDRAQAVILYCNTGHWSSVDWFVLHELLGYSNAVLYEESMAGWTRNPDLPLETGS